MEEYEQLIEEIKVLISDAKNLSADDKDLLQKTLRVIKFICQQNVLSRKLEAVSAPLEFRTQLINSIDQKIEEYKKAQQSWTQGSQTAPIPFESAKVDEYKERIDRLTELRGRVVANSYLDDIQHFISGQRRNSEPEYARLLIQCANRLAVDYYTIPRVSGELVVNIPGAPFSVTERSFSSGFSQHQNIDKILSKDAIHFMLRFLGNDEEVQKIYTAVTLSQSRDSLNRELDEQEKINGEVNYCVDNVEKYLYLKQFRTFGAKNIYEFQDKYTREQKRLQDEKELYKSTILSKLLHQKHISALSEKIEELDSIRKMFVKKASEFEVRFLFDYFGDISKNVSREDVVSTLKKKMFDTDQTKQKIKNYEEKLQACIDSMDPETKELFAKQKELCEIISMYYGRSRYRGDGHYKTSGYIGQPIMISLLALKALCESYGINTSMEITEEMQQEFDRLVTKFELLISRKDSNYQKEYDEIASLEATDYPVTR